ncbi:MAG: PilZ domain-containing protein [Granulosicoccaceae bacterium]
MQSTLTALVRERRGHDRVHDAVYLHVIPVGQEDSAAAHRSNAEAPDRKVSLSASGIFFADCGLYEPGTQITLALVLFPLKQSIVCQAKIVSAGDAAEVAKGELPTYRASFVDLSCAQTQLLEDHVNGLLSNLIAVA